MRPEATLDSLFTLSLSYGSGFSLLGTDFHLSPRHGLAQTRAKGQRFTWQELEIATMSSCWLVSGSNHLLYTV